MVNRESLRSLRSTHQALESEMEEYDVTETKKSRMSKSKIKMMLINFFDLRAGSKQNFCHRAIL